MKLLLCCKPTRQRRLPLPKLLPKDGSYESVVKVEIRKKKKNRKTKNVVHFPDRNGQSICLFLEHFLYKAVEIPHREIKLNLFLLNPD